MTAPVIAGRLARLLGMALLSMHLCAPVAAQEADGPALDVLGAPPAPAAELGRGKASWYGPRFHGRRTSSGERFDMNGFTAAHKSLPLGTRVLVRNLANGREVVVRINDRAPRMRNRIIDLSRAAAAALGFIRKGETSVVLLGPSDAGASSFAPH